MQSCFKKTTDRKSLRITDLALNGKLIKHVTFLRVVDNNLVCQLCQHHHFSLFLSFNLTNSKVSFTVKY